MIASHFLTASLKTPTVRSGFSTDSAFPSREDRRFQTANPQAPFPAPLTRPLPDTAESTVLLGLIALTVPSVIYGALQLAHVMSGSVLENAIRAFAP